LTAAIRNPRKRIGGRRGGYRGVRGSYAPALLLAEGIETPIQERCRFRRGLPAGSPRSSVSAFLAADSCSRISLSVTIYFFFFFAAFLAFLFLAITDLRQRLRSKAPVCMLQRAIRPPGQARRTECSVARVEERRGRFGYAQDELKPSLIRLFNPACSSVNARSAKILCAALHILKKAARIILRLRTR
jgi:hypothetical protein